MSFCATPSIKDRCNIMRALLKTGRDAASLLEIIEITLNKTGSKPRDNLVEVGRIRAMKVNHSRLLNQNNELKDD